LAHVDQFPHFFTVKFRNELQMKLDCSITLSKV